jgi:hypothetical protein
MTMRGLALLGFVGVTLAAPSRDPVLLQVLDSELIALVRRESDDTYRIEEVFLGPRKAGESIRLPGFDLVRPRRRGPDLVEEFRPETRILLCLKEPEPTLRRWFETTGQWADWAHDAEGIAKLRESARKSVALRRKWEEACATPDETERFEKLWPYLWSPNYRFQLRTVEQFVRMGETAGPLLAKRLPTLEHGQRMALLTELGRIGSRPLHDALVVHLKSLQRRHSAWCENYDGDPRKVFDDWNDRPDEPAIIYGELYYGLAGLVDFKDRADLPYVRSLALWAAHYRFKQVCDGALNGFHLMPDGANLRVIEAIMREFWTRPCVGNELLAYDVMRALETHRIPEAVPLLAGLLSKNEVRDEARGVLQQIVGVDLGPTAEPWLAWHRERKK